MRRREGEKRAIKKQRNGKKEEKKGTKANQRNRIRKNIGEEERKGVN